MSPDAAFKFPTMIRRLHAGPLRVHIDEYVALLREQGYSRQSARVHLQVLTDFGDWLQLRELSVSDIGASTLRHYLRCRSRFVDQHRGASSALNELFGVPRQSRWQRASIWMASATTLVVDDCRSYRRWQGYYWI